MQLPCEAATLWLGRVCICGLFLSRGPAFVSRSQLVLGRYQIRPLPSLSAHPTTTTTRKGRKARNGPPGSPRTSQTKSTNPQSKRTKKHNRPADPSKRPQPQHQPQPQPQVSLFFFNCLELSKGLRTTSPPAHHLTISPSCEAPIIYLPANPPLVVNHHPTRISSSKRAGEQISSDLGRFQIPRNHSFPHLPHLPPTSVTEQHFFLLTLTLVHRKRQGSVPRTSSAPTLSQA